MEGDSGYGAWEQMHLSQLEHYSVPQHLREALYAKLSNQVFDAAEAFVFVMSEEESPVFPVVLMANKDVDALSDVWLVDHCWEFESKFLAWQQLLTIPAIQERMLRIIGIADASDLSSQQIAQVVISKLPMCAFPLTMSSGNSESTVYYVMDEVGSWMTMVKEEPSMACVPFYDYVHGQTYSVIWPLEDIQDGEIVTRAFQKGVDVFEKGFEYWDSRFKFEGEFEWYSNFDGIKQLVEPHIRKDAHVLVPGCGTSELSADLIKEGYNSLVSCDYSPNAIATMQARHPEMQWKVADCCALDPIEWPDKTYDAIIDKGMLDALMQKSISEQISADDTWKKLGIDDVSDAQAYLKQMGRIAKDGAVLILGTLGRPENRLMLLESSGWELVEHTCIPKEKLSNCHFPIHLYVCVHHHAAEAAAATEDHTSGDESKVAEN